MNLANRVGWDLFFVLLLKMPLQAKTEVTRVSLCVLQVSPSCAWCPSSSGRDTALSSSWRRSRWARGSTSSPGPAGSRCGVCGRSSSPPCSCDDQKMATTSPGGRFFFFFLGGGVCEGFFPLREAVVGVQGSLASAAGLALQAVGRDHHEDEVRQRLLLPPVQVVQVQTLLLLIAVHALITHTHTHMSISFSELCTVNRQWVYCCWGFF